MVKKKISLSRFIILFIFLCFTSILVSARTGIFSLIIVIILYLVRNFKKKPLKIIIMFLLGVLVMPIGLKFMLSVRSGTELLQGSGRIELIYRAIEIIKNNMFMGIGFGLETIKYTYNMTVPHNFFIQYLLQFGIIGFSIILLYLLLFFSNNYKKNDLMWCFILCMTGAMLIPDVFSSRFLSIITIMTIVNRNEKLIDKV